MKQIARIREEDAIVARIHHLLTLEGMGSIFREPGNIIHKIEDMLIESLLLEAHRGMPAKNSPKTPQK